MSSIINSLNVYVVVNFLFQLIFIFPLFWGMVMYANEFKTKEKQKLTEIKNYLQHIQTYIDLNATASKMYLKFV